MAWPGLAWLAAGGGAAAEVRKVTTVFLVARDDCDADQLGHYDE